MTIRIHFGVVLQDEMSGTRNNKRDKGKVFQKKSHHLPPVGQEASTK